MKVRHPLQEIPGKNLTLSLTGSDRNLTLHGVHPENGASLIFYTFLSKLIIEEGNYGFIFTQLGGTFSTKLRAIIKSLPTTHEVHLRLVGFLRLAISEKKKNIDRIKS